MIFILTGAGISQESGLATFRDSDGTWNQVKVEDVATPGGFTRNPALVYDFYNKRRRELTSGSIEPNQAHRALARLEAEGSEEIFLVTQNVDDLHERAGSRALLHMHGELLKARCLSCEAVHEWTKNLDQGDRCPNCGRSGVLRPHIVWFEEIPLHLEEIFQALKKCRLFVAIGTSGAVYPAAGFAAEAKAHGADTLELNLEPSRVASLFHESRYGRAGEIVPQWVEGLLSNPSHGGQK